MKRNVLEFERLDENQLVFGVAQASLSLGGPPDLSILGSDSPVLVRFTPVRLWPSLPIAVVALLWPAIAHAHGVTAGDKGYILETFGTRIVPFVYLGAKHMVTGYDHLLFLAGVVFWLYRLRDVATYVTLFAVGHSITLLTGVLTGVSINAYLIDAVIGASVAYKALDNLGLLARWFGTAPDPRAATMFFGLCHGLGLATKMLDFELANDGLIPNLIAFNVGVELGQLLALWAILVALNYWRRSRNFNRLASSANVALFVSGIALVAYQLHGYFSPVPA